MEYTTTETAQEVRKALKESFPGVKFSVRSNIYTGGSCINVSWINGPPESEVKKVAGVFHGSEVDGMADLKYANGRPYGNDFIFFQREISRDKYLAKTRELVNHYVGLEKLDPTELDQFFPELVQYGVPSLRSLAWLKLKDEWIK